MVLVHIVLFEFKSSASPQVVLDACKRMLGLRENCIHPTSNKPYVLESSGGKDCSPEGHQGGLTHGFVVKFANEEDRDYYAKEDPAHIAFVKSIGEIIQAIREYLDAMAGNLAVLRKEKP